MNAAGQRQLNRALLATALVLLLIWLLLALLPARRPHWQKADAATLPAAAASTAEPAPAPPLDRYARLWNKPLFNPQRRPWPVHAHSAETRSLQLTGVLMLPDRGMAIIHDQSADKDYILPVHGQGEAGLTLVKLKPRSAVVRVGGRTTRLPLVPGTSPFAGKTSDSDAADSPRQTPPAVTIPASLVNDPALQQALRRMTRANPDMAAVRDRILKAIEQHQDASHEP